MKPDLRVTEGPKKGPVGVPVQEISASVVLPSAPLDEAKQGWAIGPSLRPWLVHEGGCLSGQMLGSGDVSTVSFGSAGSTTTGCIGSPRLG